MAHRGSSSRRDEKLSKNDKNRYYRNQGRSGSAQHQATYSTVKCTHYARNCNMVAPCCGKIVCCHRGHDSSANCPYTLDRSKVTTLICCYCKNKQGVGNSCRACKRSFGDKGCVTCRMWYSGDGFHCYGCGICRSGRQRDYKHCANCSMCYPVSSGPNGHECNPNTSDRNCAACGKDVSHSRKPSTTMRCGHYIHCDCFLERVKTSYNCPLRYCRKAVANMADWNKALDSVAAEERRRNPTTAVKIYCYDCRKTSTIQSGGSHKKCKSSNCGSYNTIRVPNSQRNLPFPLPPVNIPRR